MAIKIIKEKITLDELKEIAKENFGDMVKGVADIKERVLALGGELHADALEALIENGSEPENIWGMNIYPEKPRQSWIEFNSLINIRPTQNNLSMDIQSAEIKKKVGQIIDQLVE